MEDILEVYHREYRDDEVLVCMDETHRQQVKESRVPRAGQTQSTRGVRLRT